jgi:hypothetical protein
MWRHTKLFKGKFFFALTTEKNGKRTLGFEYADTGKNLGKKFKYKSHQAAKAAGWIKVR